MDSFETYDGLTVASLRQIGSDADGVLDQAGDVAQYRDVEDVTIPEMPAPAGGGGRPIKHLSIRTKASVASAAPLPEIVEREPGEGEADHREPGSYPSPVSLAALIDELRQLWRDRQAWRRAEKSLLLQAKARCRGLIPDGSKVEAGRLYKAALGKGEHPSAALAFARIAPLERARTLVEEDCRQVERRLLVLAKQLPVTAFVEQTRGVGLLSLAGIVGEAGDLLNYATHQRLWKRMGLAVMPDGRQRRVGGADALAHGYSPVRRSLMWNVGTCIVKAGGPLKAVYDIRKASELVTCAAIAADPAQRARYARHGARYAPRAHAHNRAQRYIEKAFLRQLHAAWRKGGSAQTEIGV